MDDRFVDLLERAVVVLEKWYDKRYPADEPLVEAIVYDPKAQKAEPESRDEYNALESGTGRYQQLIDRAKKAQS